MVATATAIVSQAQDGDRKRKQSLERAKCHHLCRHLQMRLQYARLKVEHGWEKQTLNEVENLYFHHSHQRGPKQFQSNLVVTISQPDKASYHSSSSAPQPSTLSYLAPAQGPTSTADVNAAAALSGRSTNPYMSLTLNSTRSSSTPSSSTPGQMLPPSTTPTPTVVDNPTPANLTIYPQPPTSPQRQPLPQTVLQSPVNLVSVPRPPQYSYSVFPSGAGQRLPVTANQPQAPSSSTTPPPTSSAVILSPYPKPNVPALTTTTAASSTTTSAVPSPHYFKQEPFNFGAMPTSGLTYEGFWSNHLSSSPRTNHLRPTAYSMLSTTVSGPSNLGQQAPV